MKLSQLVWFAALGVSAIFSLGRLEAQAIEPVPSAASSRIAAIRVAVSPDRPDWTYEVGEPVSFHVQALHDGHPFVGATIRYSVGPEMLPAETLTAVMGPEGLSIDGGTLAEPGFIRCVVTLQHEGQTYRGVATAGFAPERIQPKQADPADFDAFWKANLEQLARIPLEAKLTLMPEACTPDVNVYHVSFRTVGGSAQVPARIYGIYCEPVAEGKYPALLSVPGAGVRGYSGNREFAARGALTLDIGIHGIPVNLPAEVYEQLRIGALDGYNVYNLDDRQSYYYRRVYLSCVRALDFLVSRPNYDGQNLAVNGGSQGGQLSIVTAALDPRVKALAARYPAYCDVTGYLHGRAGGWPHMMRPDRSGAPSRHATEAKIATTSYYDAVNFAKRLSVPGHYVWGYNDETCPPTSMYAAYNQITAPKQLVLSLEMGHTPIPEVSPLVNARLAEQLGIGRAER
jgi:cephalosporin-C deacetylase